MRAFSQMVVTISFFLSKYNTISCSTELRNSVGLCKNWFKNRSNLELVKQKLF